MSTLIKLIFHPFYTFALDDGDEDGSNVELFYFMTGFFAVGIWLVVQRYQWIHNRAIDFKINYPIAADPKWKSMTIVNPDLKSHLRDEHLQNSVYDPSREYITCFDPATALHLETVLADNAEEIRGKISRAAEAQKEWRHSTFQERRRVIRSLKKWLVENQDACAKVACRDTGKTLIDAALGEILTTCSKMEWLIEHGERYLKPEKRHTNFMLSYKAAEVQYDPLGVVAAIVSWNYPLHNAWSPIMAAIFAGNGVVLKCSEKVIWSTSWYVDIIKTCLQACGQDPELVQLVCCWPDQANTLIQSPLIKHITFIGSEPVGRLVAQAATAHLTPVTLELGGKDPAIILPDTDLHKWSSLWLRGVFQNAGQNCIGIERLIVHSSQYDDLREIFESTIAALRLGTIWPPPDGEYVTPVDMGSMIDGFRFQHIQTLIKDAEENYGADTVGGERHNAVYYPHASFFKPTVIGPVPPEAAIAQEELFAPIALLTVYDDIDEAIDIANGTRFGLGASVFGPDQSECLEVARALDCGMVSVNDFGVFYMNQDLPFGGTKASGSGRFGGPEGLRSLTNPKAIIYDRWPALVQTSIPKVLDYPIRSLSSSWEFVSGLTFFLYGEGWRSRLAGLSALIKAARR